MAVKTTTQQKVYNFANKLIWYSVLFVCGFMLGLNTGNKAKEAETIKRKYLEDLLKTCKEFKPTQQPPQEGAK